MILMTAVMILSSYAKYMENTIIPKQLTAAIISAESAGNPRAVSPTGAKGLMQLMPIAIKDVQINAKVLPKKCSKVAPGMDLFHPRQNILAGQCYMRLMLIRFGNLDHAIRAYNAGPTKVARVLQGKGALVEETITYHKRVKSTYLQLMRVAP